MGLAFIENFIEEDESRAERVNPTQQTYPPCSAAGMGIPLNLKENYMGKMLAQLWRSLEVLFGATERIANAINNLGMVAEEMSASYVDETRRDRAKAAFVAEQEIRTLTDKVG